MSRPFRTKQFTIHQDRCAMKVGTDGLLLGGWAAIRGVRGLDIGTGTGLLALMLAQRASEAQIDAVEIDPMAAQQARENAAASPFHQRIRVLTGSIQSCSLLPGYDCILCNPPYFHTGLRAQEGSRRMARHQDELPPEVLLRHIHHLLAPHGVASLIIPAEVAAHWRGLAQSIGLHVTRLTWVKPSPPKPAHRVLLSLQRERGLPVVEQELIIQAGHPPAYTEAYRALTGSFYLDI